MLIKSKITRFISPYNKSPFRFHLLRTFIDNVEIKFVRDRGLDHVVEREKDLKSLINLKNLIKLQPSKSLPLSSIVDNNQTLKLPFRPIEFIRKYPTVFEEFFPGNIGIHPHIKLTLESLNLDAEEQLIFDSYNVRKNAADRLLKLLMLCRVNEIPLNLIDKLKWELGLPDNYVDCLIPEFPDYFRVKNRKGYEGFLELVCWSDELAVSGLEKMSKKTGNECIAFPMKYSKGFEMDKRLKKWVDEWQKLPYISPYENGVYLKPNSDEADKWAVGVLHELLNILVGKKGERENVVCFGEYLGVKSWFKRAMVHHPGIFYVSSKNGMYSVVLRDGFKRGLLIENHPLMDMRSKYIHLMRRTVKEVDKSKNEPSKRKVVNVGVVDKEGEDIGKEVDEEMQVSDDGEKLDEKMQVSDSDEDESEDESDVDDDDEDEEEQEDNARGRGRNVRRGFSEVKEDGRGRGGSSNGRRGFSKVSEENRGRGGSRSRSRGFNKVSEAGQERGGRRGFNKVNEEGRERGESGSGSRGFNKVNEVNRGRGGSRSGSRGFSRANEGEESGGSRSGQRRTSMFNEGNVRSGGRGRGRGGRSGPGNKVFHGGRNPKRNESRKFA